MKAGLYKTVSGDYIQNFVPDPSKSQVTASMTGTKTFTNGVTGDVDISTWLRMQVRCTADSTYYYGTTSTKTYGLAANKDEIIWNTGDITIIFGGDDNFVQGQ